MANRELQGTTHEIPADVIHMLNMAKKRFPNVPSSNSGMKRCNFLLKNRMVTYEVLKRLKNYFDHASEEEQYTPTYFLNGGPAMKKWINKLLGDLRSDVKLRKQAKSDGQVLNAKRKEAEFDPTSVSAAPTAWRNSDVGTNRQTIVQENVNNMLRLITYK